MICLVETLLAVNSIPLPNITLKYCCYPRKLGDMILSFLPLVAWRKGIHLLVSSSDHVWSNIWPTQVRPQLPARSIRTAPLSISRATRARDTCDRVVKSDILFVQRMRRTPPARLTAPPVCRKEADRYLRFVPVCLVLQHILIIHCISVGDAFGKTLHSVQASNCGFFINRIGYTFAGGGNLYVVQLSTVY